MNALLGVIPDSSMALKEYLQELESYISSDCSNEAKFYQFITEVAGKEKVNVDEVKQNIPLLLADLRDYLAFSLTLKEVISPTNQEVFKDEYDEILRGLILRLYKILSDIVRNYWHYLSIDFQDFIENTIYSLLKYEFSITSVPNSGLFCPELKEALILAYSILDEIEEKDLNLTVHSHHEYPLLENSKHTFKEGWADFMAGQTLPLSALWDEDNE
jgi:hypothetical protein